MYEYEVENKVPILLALSTCPRCRGMKEFLRKNGIAAAIVDVDLLPKKEKRENLDFLRRVNPRVSFPTLVVGDQAVIGEDYDSVREVLGL